MRIVFIDSYLDFLLIEGDAGDGRREDPVQWRFEWLCEQRSSARQNLDSAAGDEISTLDSAFLKKVRLDPTSFLMILSICKATSPISLQMRKVVVVSKFQSNLLEVSHSKISSTWNASIFIYGHGPIPINRYKYGIFWWMNLYFYPIDFDVHQGYKEFDPLPYN